MEFFKLCLQLSMYLCGIMFFVYLSVEIIFLAIENGKKRKLNDEYNRFFKELVAKRKDGKK